MPARNLIAGPDGETGIEPKIMAVLCVLATEPGRVFTRAELIDRVWGTEYGADESLTRAISHLRKALGDTRSEPAVIETIAKRGYRLLPSAVAGEPPSATPARPNRRAWVAGGGALISAGALAWWFKPYTRTGIPVIVPPVNPLGKAPELVAMAAALTADLAGMLARDGRLHVTVRKPDPATAPGRRYAIYADLQITGGELRCHAEIMNYDTVQALWSRVYERPFDGQLKSQDRLSADITRDLIAGLLELESKH